MALVLADRVRETTTTTGTGTVSLAGPVSGFEGFSTAIGNANTTYYAIVDAATGAWEVGLGTYTSSGSTLARTTILSSSNAGSAVNFAAGTKDVFVTQPAERALYLNGAGTGVDAGAAAFTANGVVYASSTSALTTGSALTFDGTNLGVGSNAPGQKFVVNGASGVAMQLENSSDSNRGGRFVASGSAASGTFAVNTTSSGYALTFGIDSSEQMRLTSTGLGIGTSSPGSRLAVIGSANMAYFYDGSTSDFQIQAVSNRTEIGSTTNTPLSFKTNNTERMRLDSSGNLGLGVTPVATWGATYKAIQVGLGGALTGRTNAQTQTILGANWYVDTGNKFIGAGYASQYQQDSGVHYWYTSTIAGAAAGDPISFTQAMTLDASGNLLVGTTSTSTPGCVLAAVGRVSGTVASISTACFQAWSQATSGDNLFQEFYTEGGGGSLRGSISYNRAGGLVAYNVTSDYRAKDISGPVVGSGALIDATPVYMGKMKGATQERPMFIAHEVPAYAHTGEKDAVDADGKPVYQQMDASALIPVMWAEIQDLRKRLAAAGI
jgi:hypothetical protein